MNLRTLDLGLLRTFIAVAEYRSMTATASHLHMTQGAVSQQIKRLEEALGSALLTRERRGMQLTSFGERLLSRARQMLALNDQIWAEIRGDTVVGRVRLGVPYDLAGAWIAPALKSFIEVNPQVELALKCGSSLELLGAMEQGALDLAVVEQPLDALSGECLTVERLVWAGARGGTAFLRTPLPISLVADTCAFREPVLGALERRQRPWKTLFENGNLEATIAMVHNDLAISAWLKSTVPASLDILAADAQLPELPSFAISLQRPDGAENPAAEELVRHIRQHLARA